MYLWIICQQLHALSIVVPVQFYKLNISHDNSLFSLILGQSVSCFLSFVKYFSEFFAKYFSEFFAKYFSEFFAKSDFIFFAKKQTPVLCSIAKVPSVCHHHINLTCHTTVIIISMYTLIALLPSAGNNADVLYSSYASYRLLQS